MSPNTSGEPISRRKASKGGTAAIILNWRQPKATISCIEALLSEADQALSIYVVENGSGDDSASILNRYSSLLSEPKLEIIPVEVNRGFAGGCNVGINRAVSDGCERILLINNDAIVTSGSIKAMTDLAEDEGVGIVGAVIKSSDNGKILFTSRKWPGHLFGFGNKTSLPDVRRWRSDCIDGCAMILTRELVDRLIRKRGYVFEESFFMYWEDDEVCLASASLGLRNMVCGAATVKHSVALSSGGWGNPRGFYYLTRNRVPLARRWLPFPILVAFHLWYIPSRLCVALIRALQGNSQGSRAILVGLRDGYCRRMGCWTEHQ